MDQGDAWKRELPDPPVTSRTVTERFPGRKVTSSEKDGNSEETEVHQERFGPYART